MADDYNPIPDTEIAPIFREMEQWKSRAEEMRETLQTVGEFMEHKLNCNSWPQGSDRVCD